MDIISLLSIDCTPFMGTKKKLWSHKRIIFSHSLVYYSLNKLVSPCILSWMNICKYSSFVFYRPTLCYFSLFARVERRLLVQVVSSISYQGCSLSQILMYPFLKATCYRTPFSTKTLSCMLLNSNWRNVCFLTCNCALIILIYFWYEFSLGFGKGIRLA